MLKHLNRLWLKGLRQAGKIQRRQTGKLLRSILSKPAKTTSAKKKTDAAKPSPASAPAVRPKAGAASSGTAASKKPRPLPGQWLSAYTVSKDTTRRRISYRLYWPSSAGKAGSRSAQRVPLVLMLHGCAQDAQEFADGTRMNALAEQKGWAVLYPQQSQRINAHRCWRWFDAASQRGDGDAAAVIAALEKILQTYPIDRSRIYAAGISAGAGMAQIVALLRPDLIAAIGLHSGPVFGGCRSVIGAYRVMQHGALGSVRAIQRIALARPDFPPMPALLISGRDDDIVRQINQMQLLTQMRLLNRHSELQQRPPDVRLFGRISKAQPNKNRMDTQDFVAGKKTMLRAITIDRLGHAWSGGDSCLPFNSAGPDASKLMLAFFAGHRRDADAPSTQPGT
jgi:poly(hydroxyalkanoate) depolymerase family esterase